MTKKPFSFFLEMLFVLFFFLITSTILIEIYAKMMQISKLDSYRQDAMVLAQNEIEGQSDVGVFQKKMHSSTYQVKITQIEEDTYRIRIYTKKQKVLDYKYHKEVSHEAV